MDLELKDGLLPVFKPVGPTSHDVVKSIRNHLSGKKVGHSGTLDPFAGGVLILGIGKGTRILEYVLNQRKTYEMTFQLGLVTDTYDITGKVMKEEIVDFPPEEICDVVMSFLGEYQQVPPMYSAKKVEGVKLYQLAREGKVITMPPRRVQIDQLEILEIDGPRVKISASVSSGTYMRSLAMDIGYRLGCGATAIELIRTENAGYRLEDCFRWSPEPSEPEGFLSQVLPFMRSLEKALDHLPAIRVLNEEIERVKHGAPIFSLMVDGVSGPFEKDSVVRIMTNQGRLLAIGKSERRSNFIETLQQAERNERVAKLTKVFA